MSFHALIRKRIKLRNSLINFGPWGIPPNLTTVRNFISL
jgi:hypothetical protein